MAERNISSMFDDELEEDFLSAWKPSASKEPTRIEVQQSKGKRKTFTSPKLDLDFDFETAFAMPSFDIDLDFNTTPPKDKVNTTKKPEDKETFSDDSPGYSQQDERSKRSIPSGAMSADNSLRVASDLSRSLEVRQDFNGVKVEAEKKDSFTTVHGHSARKTFTELIEAKDDKSRRDAITTPGTPSCQRGTVLLDETKNANKIENVRKAKTTLGMQDNFLLEDVTPSEHTNLSRPVETNQSRHGDQIGANLPETVGQFKMSHVSSTRLKNVENKGSAAEVEIPESTVPPLHLVTDPSTGNSDQIGHSKEVRNIQIKDTSVEMDCPTRSAELETERSPQQSCMEVNEFPAQGSSAEGDNDSLKNAKIVRAEDQRNAQQDVGEGSHSATVVKVPAVSGRPSESIPSTTAPKAKSKTGFPAHDIVVVKNRAGDVVQERNFGKAPGSLRASVSTDAISVQSHSSRIKIHNDVLHRTSRNAVKEQQFNKPTETGDEINKGGKRKLLNEDEPKRKQVRFEATDGLRKSLVILSPKASPCPVLAQSKKLNLSVSGSGLPLSSRWTSSAGNTTRFQSSTIGNTANQLDSLQTGVLAQSKSSTAQKGSSIAVQRKSDTVGIEKKQNRSPSLNRIPEKTKAGVPYYTSPSTNKTRTTKSVPTLLGSRPSMNVKTKEAVSSQPGGKQVNQGAPGQLSPVCREETTCSEMLTLGDRERPEKNLVTNEKIQPIEQNRLDSAPDTLTPAVIEELVNERAEKLQQASQFANKLDNLMLRLQKLNDQAKDTLVRALIWNNKLLEMRCPIREAKKWKTSILEAVKANHDDTTTMPEV